MITRVQIIHWAEGAFMLLVLELIVLCILMSDGRGTSGH